MSQQKSQPSHNIPVWGIFLLFLGIVLLLQNLKVLPWELWETLWRFWPVVVISFGLGILLRHRNPWLISGLIMLVFLGCLGIAYWQYEQSAPGGTPVRNYSTPLGNLTTAQAEIELSAGSLTVDSLTSGSPNLIEAESGSDDAGNIMVDFQSQGTEGTLRLTTNKASRHLWNKTGWRINLSRRIPFTMAVQSNVGDLALNFKGIMLTELQMDLNAGSCIMTMPFPTDKTSAYIKANIANMELTIPQGVAARIKVKNNLSDLNVDTNRFPKKGDYYVSDGFSTSVNRLEIELNCNLSRVEIK